MLYDFFDNVKINLPKGLLWDDGEFSSIDKNLNINGNFSMSDLYDDDGDICDFEEWFDLVKESLSEGFGVEITSPTFLNTQYKTGFVAFPVQREVQGTVASLLALAGAVQVDDENVIIFSGTTAWREGDEEGNLERFSMLVKIFRGITVGETKITLNSFTPAKIMKKYISEENMLTGVNELKNRGTFLEFDENDKLFKLFDFSSKNTEIFDNNLIIPVPDGFEAYANKGYIGAQEELIIVTEDHDDLTNYFDAPFVLTVQKIPINIKSGAVNKQTIDYYEGILRRGNGFVSDADVLRFGFRDGFIAFAQSLVDFDCPTYNKLKSYVCTDNGIYQCSITCNHSYDASDDDVIECFVERASRWLEAIRVVGEKDFASFPNTFTNSELYSFYEQTMSMKNNAFPGVVVRTSGFAYSFVPLVKEIQNRGFSLDSKDAEEQIFGLLGNEDSEYTLWQEAEKMAPIFRVSKAAFDFKHDKECALKEGFAREAYMMSALRSFAWILSAYCDENNLKPEEVQLDDILEIIDCAERRNWLSYNDSSYCQGLCGCDDINVAYTPESIPSIILLGFMGEFTRTHSLEELRKDLEYIAPAIRRLYLYLLDGRERNSALEGNEADILYMWCVLAKAAKSSFFVDNGPGTRVFDQITDCVDEYRPDLNASNTSGMFAKENTPATPHHVKRNKYSKRIPYDIPEDQKQYISLDDCEMDGTTLLKYSQKIEKPYLVFPDGIETINNFAIDVIGAKGVILGEGFKFYEGTIFSGGDTLEYLYLPSTFEVHPEGFGLLHCEMETKFEMFDVSENNPDATSIDGVLYSTKDGQLTIFEVPSACQTLYLSADVADINHFNVGIACSLKEIDVDPQNGRYKSIDGMLCEKVADKTSLIVVPANTKGTLKIPDGIEIIGSMAFQHNEKIEHIILTEEIVLVEDLAFEYVPNLLSLDVPSLKTEFKMFSIFHHDGDKWVIQCIEGSKVDEMAKERGWPVDYSKYAEKAEMLRKAREEAERKAREEAECKAREEAERKARKEAERKAREEAERKAKEEAERKAKEEAERIAREEEEILKRREEFIAAETEAAEKQCRETIAELSAEFEKKDNALAFKIDKLKKKLIQLEQELAGASFFAFSRKRQLKNEIQTANSSITAMEDEKKILSGEHQIQLNDAQTKRKNQLANLPMRAVKKFPVPSKLKK